MPDCGRREAVFGAIAVSWARAANPGKMDREKTKGLIQKAYGQLKAFDVVGSDEQGEDLCDDGRCLEVLKAAADLLEQALDEQDLEAKHALKSVEWWLVNLSRIETVRDPYDRGEFILSKLRKYYSFLQTLPEAQVENFELCQYLIRRFVFSAALRCFRDLLGDGANQHDPGLLLLVGRCYKGVGIYEEALRYIEQAARFRREDGETLAELADVNALLGETGKAKALFREAFFISPEKVNLQMMESELIIRLRDKLAREKGYAEEELREWMPVYGKLWGVFSIQRELRPVEFGRLKQSIHTMETESRGNPGRASVLRPRLINRYFWLIDYYDNRKEDVLLREEVLMKIRVTDPEIYQRYVQ